MTNSNIDNPPRLLLVDGHSLAYRAFFALPVENFATKTGQPTNAVYGFTSMLINVLRAERPTHLVVAFDVSRHSFRTDKYPDYKANRATSPEEFKGQVELIKEVLDALNIVHLELPGYEADDIIATLASRADPEVSVLICTGDRDSLQLVNDHVTVLYPKKGVSDLARLTPAVVEEKYLVPPERYPELAALVGESSDNLPGVPGVGPKTAAKWLTLYDGLEGVLAAAHSIKGKVGDSLREHLADVQRNRSLNALVRDLALPLTFAEAERKSWDRDRVHQLFDALEFRVLRERLLETLPTEETEPDSGFEVTGEILHQGDVAEWLSAHTRPTARIGVDVLGRWGSGSGELDGIALAASDGAACWIGATDLSAEDKTSLRTWLADPDQPKAIHGAKGPLLALWQQDLNMVGVTCDTELAAYLLRPDQRSYDLADLSIRHLRKQMRAETATDQPSLQDAFDFDDHDQAGQASMVRARAVIDVAVALDQELSSQSGATLLRDVELPLARTLARMEQTGIAADVPKLQQLRQEFDAGVNDAAEAAYSVIGKQINLSSPKQLQAVLFDDLAMPKTRKTATGFTTDAEALANLYTATEHPFLAHVLAHRDSIRLRQVVDGLLAAVKKDGRIHTTYLQTVAGTGRLSSTEPNLQNIPIRTDMGRQIRQAFVVGEGFETLFTADYSQIEMRIMADVSGDDGLIEAFKSGEDFHSWMAARVFGVEPAEVSSQQRAKIKAMNYGLAYGLSAFGLSNQLQVSVSDAKQLMEEYFERFGKIRDFLDGVVAQARKNGYTETILGRRRYLPDLTSSNRQRREMAERAALNAPIQGSAADIIKVAMLRIEDRLREDEMRSRMLLQVHDELIIEVAPTELDRVAALVREAMAHAVDLRVPLDVSVGQGHSWFAAAH